MHPRDPDVLLCKRYRLLGPIGAGAMGVVYRCRDEHLHRYVAVKTLHAGLVTSAEARDLVRNEALALSSLNHPNIGTIHDFLTENDRDFLVMELIEGPTLTERLKAEGALPVRDILQIGHQIALGLAAAHERGIVHRQSRWHRDSP